MTRLQRAAASVIYYTLWSGVAGTAMYVMAPEYPVWVRTVGTACFVLGLVRVLFSTPNLGEEKTTK